MTASILIAFATFPSQEAAQQCVRALVTQRFIACGTLLPGATSIYRWQGEVETAQETVVMMKLRADCWEAVETHIRTHHPYDVPELIAIPVGYGHEPYLSWVASEGSDA